MKAIHKYYELAGSSSNREADGQRVKAGAGPEQGYLFVRADRKMQKLMYDDILYVEGLKDYVKIITEDRMVITKQTIGNLDKQLPPGMFLRCHRSYIVNLTRVTAYTSYDIEIGRAEIPIGGNYREVVSKALQ
jgi:DNA-binding LytR/AlgR family response regulator